MHSSKISMACVNIAQLQCSIFSLEMCIVYLNNAIFSLSIFTSSQIYRLHGFVPNLCEICYFIGLYNLNMNVMHYLNTKVVCMTLMCK
jgi:hypothetical protein